MDIYSTIGSFKNFFSKSNACLKDFAPLKFLASNSESPSDIWIFKSDIGNQLIFCKVFVQSNYKKQKKNDTCGLEYESKVYLYIKKQLSKPEYVDFKDNFVQLENICKNLTFSELMSKVCVNGNVTEARLKRNVQYMICGETDKRPALDKGNDYWVKGCGNVVPENFQYTIIATRSPENNTDHIIPLWFFVQDNIPFEAKASVIAITALSIHAMHQMGIYHNDQHWSNIIVAITEETRVYEYTHKNVSYKFNTSARPVLFDWDLAQLCEGGSKNEYLNDFPQIFPAGQSRANKTRDIFRFYTTLRFMMLKLDKKDIIQKIDKVFIRDVSKVPLLATVDTFEKQESVRHNIEDFIQFDVGLLLYILGFQSKYIEASKQDKKNKHLMMNEHAKQPKQPKQPEQQEGKNEYIVAGIPPKRRITRCRYRLINGRLCTRNTELTGIHCWQHRKITNKLIN